MDRPNSITQSQRIRGVGLGPGEPSPAVRAKTTIQSVLGAGYVSIVDFVGSPDVGLMLNNAVSSLPSSGGVIDARSLTGDRVMNSWVVLNKPNVTILFGSIKLTVSGVTPTQTPVFQCGNFQFQAENCWIIGIQGQTKIISDAGSETCLITQYSTTGGGVRYLDLDGNKANNSALSDDTFQCGIDIIQTGAQNGVSTTTEDSAFTVDSCTIHDFIHNGIVVYGADNGSGTGMASSNVITNNVVQDNGKATDALSTGYGIAINKGASHNFVSSNRVYRQKRTGIWLCTAGLSQVGNNVSDNWVSLNDKGIVQQEESDFGSTLTATQTGCNISRNYVSEQTVTGISIEVDDSSSGQILGTIVSHNIVAGNGYGIAVVGTNSTSSVNNVVIDGNQVYLNTNFGFIANASAFDTVLQNNFIIGNGTNISDSGTRSVVAGNKTDSTTGTYNVPGEIVVGLLTAINMRLADLGVLTLSESGVRTWTIGPQSGGLSLGSGDGEGRLSVPLSGGLATAGPIQPTTVSYANRPGFGTLAAVTPQNGMVISIADATTAAWGANITSGGGTNTVLAWYNSSISQWTVIGS